MLSIFDAEIDRRPELKGWILIKLAAACSKTQQPCDVSPIFMALKTLAKSHLRTKFEGGDMTQAHWLETVLLANIPAPSRKTFCNFLLQAPSLVGNALKPGNIEQGWRDSGLWPFDIPTLLAQCPRLELLTKPQTAALVAAVGPLSVLMREQGQLTEAQLQAAVGDTLSLDNLCATYRDPPVAGTPLHHMALNRRRALILLLVALPEASSDESASDEDPDAPHGDECECV